MLTSETAYPSASLQDNKSFLQECCMQFLCFLAHEVIRCAILTGRVLLSENKRNAIEILLKAASYFECAIKAVLPNTPDDIK
jgi:hypothetical protein